VQRQFNDFAQLIGGKQIKGVLNSAGGAANKSESRQPVIDMQKRIEGIWIKTERVNTEMVRTFSQLIGK